MTKSNIADTADGYGTIPSGGFHMEGQRSGRGMSLLISGIIGLRDFSDTCILLMSHGGRIIISGRRLLLSVYEGNCVEINGRVEGIEFRYGKD